MNFPAHTLKVSVQVQKWRFYSLSNSLVIVMDPLGTSPDSSTLSPFLSFIIFFCFSVINKCIDPCTGTSEDDSLRWVMTVVSNVTLYGQFIDKAELDGRVRGVKYEYKTDGITATIPHFWDYAGMLPSPLLSPCSPILSTLKNISLNFTAPSFPSSHSIPLPLFTHSST